MDWNTHCLKHNILKYINFLFIDCKTIGQQSLTQQPDLAVLVGNRMYTSKSFPMAFYASQPFRKRRARRIDLNFLLHAPFRFDAVEISEQ